MSLFRPLQIPLQQGDRTERPDAAERETTVPKMPEGFDSSKMPGGFGGREMASKQSGGDAGMMVLISCAVLGVGLMIVKRYKR